jgi:uncharacterized phage protein (TIGR02218 family)
VKTASANLIALLQTSKEFYVAEVYTIAPLTGNAMHYTTFDSDISWNGTNYNSAGLLLNRSRISQVCGLEVAELEIEAFPTTANIGNVGFLAGCVNGALDGAQIKLERLFYSSWSDMTPVGGITLFNGFVGGLDANRTGALIKVSSLAELLAVPWPRLTYQAGCVWRFYDAGCGKNRTALTVSGAVTAGIDSGNFQTNLNQADGYFNLGVVVFTSGNCTGSRRTIKQHWNSYGGVRVTLPLPYTPSANDAFTIYPGCDHSYNTCVAQFINGNNFRGFPYIPVPETGI